MSLVRLFKQFNDSEAVLELVTYLLGYLDDKATDVNRFLGYTRAVAGNLGMKLSEARQMEVGECARQLKHRFWRPWIDILIYFASVEELMQKLIEHTEFSHACLIEDDQIVYVVSRREARNQRPANLEQEVQAFEEQERTGAARHLVLVIDDEVVRVINLPPKAVAPMAGA